MTILNRSSSHLSTHNSLGHEIDESELRGLTIRNRSDEDAVYCKPTGTASFEASLVVCELRGA